MNLEVNHSRQHTTHTSRKFSMPRQRFAIILHLLIVVMLVVECFGDTAAPVKYNRRWKKAESSRVLMVDIKDKIIELQCCAKCERNLTLYPQLDINNTESSRCREQCRIDARKSPRHGICPSTKNVIFHNLMPKLDDLSCAHYCNYDYDCPDVRKCCQTDCGPICMPPIQVRDDKLLPGIPKIRGNKWQRGHKAEITIESAMNETCYFHVEARSYIGTVIVPRKFGPWHWQRVDKIGESLDYGIKKTDFSFNVKPGRLYQVRVAAINAYGFRGYSEPTSPFSLLRHPKPPMKPKELRVVSAEIDGDFFKVKIAWSPSKSVLPVERYKVMWALYIKSRGHSFISNEAFVKNGENFVIPQLIPDSCYYIQVQAISINGRKRLKSEKQSIFYNTTTIVEANTSTQSNYVNLEHINGQHGGQTDKNLKQISTKENTESTSIQEQSINDTTTSKIQRSTTNSSKTTHQIQFRMNRKLGMIVQISGFPTQKEKVYELCPKEAQCEQREYSAIRTKKNSLLFSKLKYNTTYFFRAYRNDENRNTGTKPIVFTTPKCEKFSKRYPKMQIKC